MKLSLLTGAVYATNHAFNEATKKWNSVLPTAETQGWAMNGVFYSEITYKNDTPFLVVKTVVHKAEPLINGNIV